MIPQHAKKRRLEQRWRFRATVIVVAIIGCWWLLQRAWEVTWR